MRPTLPAILCLLLAPAAVHADEPGTSIVEITRTDGGLGAGVQIAPGLILTAAHVVGDEPDVTVIDSHHREQPGRVVAVDPVLDLALLVPEVPERIAVSAIACVLPKPGLRVTMTGHPMGTPFVSVMTTVAGPPGPVSDWQSLVPLTTQALPGMSGGPVIAGDGSVVALVVAAISMPGWDYGPAAAVPSADICRYLSSLLCQGHGCGRPGIPTAVSPIRDAGLRRLVAHAVE